MPRLRTFISNIRLGKDRQNEPSNVEERSKLKRSNARLQKRNFTNLSDHNDGNDVVQKIYPVREDFENIRQYSFGAGDSENEFEVKPFALAPKPVRKPLPNLKPRSMVNSLSASLLSSSENTDNTPIPRGGAFSTTYLPIRRKQISSSNESQVHLSRYALVPHQDESLAMHADGTVIRASRRPFLSPIQSGPKAKGKGRADIEPRVGHPEIFTRFNGAKSSSATPAAESSPADSAVAFSTEDDSPKHDENAKNSEYEHRRISEEVDNPIDAWSAGQAQYEDVINASLARKPSIDSIEVRELLLKEACAACAEDATREQIEEERLKREQEEEDRIQAQQVQEQLRKEQEEQDRIHALEIEEQLTKEREEEERLAAERVRLRDCAVCGDSMGPLEFPARPPTMKCEHSATTCKECLQSWMASEFETKGCDGIKCPECPENLEYNDVQEAASAETFESYDKLAMRTALGSLDEFSWCLQAGCGSGQLNIENKNFMDCANCGYKQCLQHKVPWHKGETCDQYEYRTSGQKARDEEKKTEAVLDSLSKRCPGPNCGWRIQKVDGCEHMTCKKCKFEFCWLCLASHKEIKRVGNTAHAASCKFHSNNLTVSWPFNMH